MDQCVCCSGETYELCCKPYHLGKIPENALKLMRSRYSAYALNLADYIVKTTHPASRQYGTDQALWKQQIVDFSLHTQFKGLEVLDFQENDQTAVVTFVAHLFQQDNEVTITEKSHFTKTKGSWLYLSGQIAQGHAPHLISKQPIKLLPIAYYAHPILRTVAAPVEEINEALKAFINEMIETMNASNGIGLAAPQVYRSIQLFIIRVPTENPDGSLQWGEVKVFINPKISSWSQETWKANEGCLSIPTVRVEVERSKRITITYTDVEGKRITETCTGWQARVILHEYDHIQGVLFIDHLDPQQLSQLEPILREIDHRIHT